MNARTPATPVKSRAGLIAASLLVNAALFGALAWRPTLSPPVFRDFFKRNFHVLDSADASRPAALATPAAARSPAPWAALSTDDLPTLVARLRAAGFPASIIREIVRAQVNAHYNPRLAALMAPDPNTPYWRASPYYASTDSKVLEEINQLQRARAKELRELLQDDVFATGDVSAAQRRQFGNLSRQKVDLVQRVEDDYNEMFSQVRAGMKGVTLPEDREKLALLQREKQADLAGVLTPEEFTDYTMRTSQITTAIRSRLTLFDPSEAEFRAIFQAQLDLNTKFPVAISGGVISNGDYEQRMASVQDLEKKLQAALGDARYADYSRATSTEFQQLNRLVQRDNLPADAAIQAYGVRDQIAEQSNRIFDDPNLSADEKRAALQTLAQNTRSQLLSSLGPTSGPAYVKIADQWLTNVERGGAVTFKAGGGMSYYSSNSSEAVMVSLGNSSPNYRRLPPPPHK